MVIIIIKIAPVQSFPPLIHLQPPPKTPKHAAEEYVGTVYVHGAVTSAYRWVGGVVGVSGFGCWNVKTTFRSMAFLVGGGY